jgi:DNA-binding HxlR family transcriptional regulator
MGQFRYPHFCPVSRAAEVVGERWTLLIVRELLLGPQRFSDLRRRLHRVSSSVLSDRLEGLETRGLVARRELPPPAATTVYELTALGRTLEPVLLELGRFGAQLLLPPREDEHFEPEWTRLAFAAFAKRTASPPLRFSVELRAGEARYRYAIEGGPHGTRVREATPDPQAVRLSIDAGSVGALIGGFLDLAAARASGALVWEGDEGTLAAFPSLFEMNLGPSDPRPKPGAEPRRIGGADP